MFSLSNFDTIHTSSIGEIGLTVKKWSPGPIFHGKFVHAGSKLSA